MCGEEPDHPKVLKLDPVLRLDRGLFKMPIYALIPEGRVRIKVEAKFFNALVASPKRRDSLQLAFGIVIRSNPFR